MDCCGNCQDYKSCKEKSGCCIYCDHYSPNGCKHMEGNSRKDRLAEYEEFKLTSAEFGDFYNAD